MPDFSSRFEQLINELLPDINKQKRYERDRTGLLRGGRNNPTFDSQFDLLERLIESQRASQYLKIEQFLRYPPFHDHHLTFIDQFHGNTLPQSQQKPFEKSVFIMTKFPELDANKQPKSAADQELKTVIESVQSAVAASGFFPRVASDHEFHQMLWENVELYLLGCARGIAILESKYKPELNPNVAMEWGWMRGMGKEVFMLVEDSFTYLRADWGGLIEHKFPWGNPGSAITGHVTAWLTGAPASPPAPTT
jgi:hypothetical protein